jgi:hypothetical protein
VVSSDLTCLQVLNALTWSFTSKRFDPDRPFTEFIQEYIHERRTESPDPPRQQVGDRPPQGR